MGLKESINRLLEKKDIQEELRKIGQTKEQKTGETLPYFLKTRQLLEKIKLYKDLTVFDSGFDVQLQLVNETIRKGGHTFDEYKELEKLAKEINQKFLDEQFFPGSHQPKLSDSILKALFERYKMENVEVLEKAKELNERLIHQRKQQEKILSEMLETKKELEQINAFQYQIFEKVVAGLTFDDIERLKQKGISID